MLSLGIPIDFDAAGNTVVDLNIGGELKANDFPQDSDFQLLAFRPSAKTGQVVWIDELARDISEALLALEQAGFKHTEIEWHRRLALYCSGSNR
jgi:hypothetical protein